MHRPPILTRARHAIPLRSTVSDSRAMPTLLQVAPAVDASRCSTLQNVSCSCLCFHCLPCSNWSECSVATAYPESGEERSDKSRKLLRHSMSTASQPILLHNTTSTCSAAASSPVQSVRRHWQTSKPCPSTALGQSFSAGA